MSSQCVNKARAAFREGRTLKESWRRSQLLKLHEFLIKEKKLIFDALYKDMKKVYGEAHVFEYDMCMNELSVHLNNLKTWMKPTNAKKTLITMLDKAVIIPQPMGVMLIIAPWNYPLHLTIIPLIGAISSGNCAIIKPSELCPTMSSLLANLLTKYLDKDCFQVIEGGIPETSQLLELRFDLIFYTGSTAIGKIIMTAAAKHITPCILELGGKCPVYIDDNSDMYVVARRLCWAKYSNAGQTCLTPDYVLCSESVKQKLIPKMKEILLKFYGEDVEKDGKFTRIINNRHFNRIRDLLKGTHILVGDLSKIDEDELFIPPLVVEAMYRDQPIMQHEVFGPILTIFTVKDVTEAINFINDGEKPLGLYAFTNDHRIQQRFIEETYSGGVTFNDLLMHTSISSLPFGGVGHSGMGNYHGKHSFDSFSHKRSILTRTQYLEKIMDIRCPPFNDTKSKLASWFTTDSITTEGSTGHSSLIYNILFPFMAISSVIIFFIKILHLENLIPDKFKQYL